MKPSEYINVYAYDRALFGWNAERARAVYICLLYFRHQFLVKYIK